MDRSSPPQMQPTRVLVVDDEPSLLCALELLLRRAGCRVVALESPLAAAERLVHEDFDVALLDVKLAELSGLELLALLKQRRPEVEVVMMTGHATVETALAALRAGAYDYLTKPFEDVDLVVRVVAKAAERKRLIDRTRLLEQRLDSQDHLAHGLVGSSSAIRDVVRMVDAVAYSAATVLVQGESGTGKELVARALHARSPRGDKPLVTLNCGALSETLLESELFGHVKGAFTGAHRDQKGIFEAADGGTVFLDEIGDTPPATQVRLLRVLQDGEVKRVGAAESVRVDVRVVGATHRDLPRLVREGRFREDLFYRLNVITIPVPPLRDRIDDVPLLAAHFLRSYAGRLGSPARTLAPDAVELLCSHRWPGNVRELENAIERAVVLCRGEAITPAELPPTITRHTAPLVRLPATDEAELATMTYMAAKDQALRRFEKSYVQALMRASDGSISGAARKAGMDRSNFKRVLNRYRDDLDLEEREGSDPQRAAG
jgi:two-component system, NtrC family, response regulator HydG